MKRSFYAMFTMAVVTSILLIAACSKSDLPQPSPTANLIKINEGYAMGAAAKVEVYGSSAITNTGYNKFYLAVYDSLTGNRIEQAAISLTPMMEMGTMQHSSPFENPAATQAVNTLFPCSVVFIMPSTAGNWTVKINVSVNNKIGSLTIPVNVIEPVKSKMKSFTSIHNNGKYFIALVAPATPKIGINDMELVVYKKESMMSFPADNSFTIGLTPEMPTMGHGSPNNVNPVSVGNGHYKGKVNFTMTGYWKLNLNFKVGDQIADSTQFFDIEF